MIKVYTQRVTGLPNAVHRRFFTVTTLLLASVMLMACGGSSNSGGSSVASAASPTASVRVIHASQDAPPVNVLVDGAVAIQNLDYAASSGFLSLTAGSVDIVVEGIVPGGNIPVISATGLNLPENSRTTVIAVDPVATIEPLLVPDSASAPGNDQVALQVVHASPAAPAVDIYVTAPGDDINAATPAFSIDYKGYVDAGALTAGVVQIRAALAGTKTVVYDSDSVDLGPFAGSALMVVAVSTVNPTTQSAAPIKLLVATDSALVELFDASTTAGARVVHASPDAGSAAGGPVEVFASSAALGPTPVEIIDAFVYLDTVPAVNSHVALPAGDYIFDVAPDTDSVGDSVFTSGSVTLSSGSEYTVVAAGRVLSAPPFGLLFSADNSRAVATQASLKVVHAAPAAGDVDVYATPAGTVSVIDIENGTAGMPLLTGFAFGEITDYVAVTSGNYDIRVVAGGVVAINIENLTLAAGSVSTAIARGPIEPPGVPSDFGVVLLTN